MAKLRVKDSMNKASQQTCARDSLTSVATASYLTENVFCTVGAHSEADPEKVFESTK